MFRVIWTHYLPPLATLLRRSDTSAELDRVWISDSANGQASECLGCVFLWSFCPLNRTRSRILKAETFGGIYLNELAPYTIAPPL
jgi:hypothetical protein